ncbi:MAG: hypothetical protein NZ894_04950, partial [Archaeoglobaceae archaeon]|nr:hypothetical protein [Archaeoglobaceae archaeon]
MVIIEIKAYNNPWMDNGIENFCRTLESFQSCETELRSDSFRIKINNLNEFINEFTKVLEIKKKNMIVLEIEEETNIQKEVKKDYVA